MGWAGRCPSWLFVEVDIGLMFLRVGEAELLEVVGESLGESRREYNIIYGEKRNKREQCCRDFLGLSTLCQQAIDRILYETNP